MENTDLNGEKAVTHVWHLGLKQLVSSESLLESQLMRGHKELRTTAVLKQVLF